MPDPDLTAFQTQSEQQLREIIRQAQAELQERQEAKKRKAVDEIRQILAENELDPRDVFAQFIKGKKKKKKSAAPAGRPNTATPTIPMKPGTAGAGHRSGSWTRKQGG